MQKCFEPGVHNKVANLALNRPEKRNALLPGFWSAFPEEIERLSRTGEARAIILSARGSHFCAGMDLSVFAGSELLDTSTPRERERLRGLVLGLQDAVSALERARIPVIAAVQGACVGAGLDLVAACDFRFATRDAFFCIQEINIGIMADLGTLQRLPKKMPDGIARQLAYTGDSLSAQRAMEVGFVNRVFDDMESMQEHVQAVAERIASKPALAVSLSKESINYAVDHPVQESLQYAANLQAFLFEKSEIGLKPEALSGSEHDLKPQVKSLQS